MALRDVARTRGSKCVQAQPAGQTSVGVWGSGRQGRRPLATAHPIVRLCTIREPPPVSPRRQRRPSIHKQVLWIRRPWPLQFMAANGRRQNRRKQVRAGSACRPPKEPGELAMPVLCPRCVAPAAASGVQDRAAQSEVTASSEARYCAQCSCGCGRQRDQGSLRLLP